MFVKKFKRKCDVRGCKNVVNTFLISKRREMGNTIAICTDCLKEAQASIDGYVEEKKTIKAVNKPLFPHPELEVTLSSVADDIEPTEVIEENTEDIPISVAEDTVTFAIPENPKGIIEYGLKGEEGELPIITKPTTPKKKPNKKK